MAVSPPFFEDAWLTVHQGDWVDVLRTLPSESVNCVVTSPPYWGLRDYGMDGQLGLERTPEEYVERLVAGFREVRRVLRGDGTCWLVLGDSYATGAGSYRNPGSDVSPIDHGGKQAYTKDYARAQPNRMPIPGLKPKDLVGIPWRVAFALQADGWYLRSDIIWSKPNPMPESVTDRPTKSHEYLFLLSKSARYYYDQQAVAEGLTESSVERLSQPTLDQQAGSDRVPGKTNGPMKAVGHLDAGYLQPLLDAGFEFEVVSPPGNPTWQERKAAGATAGNIGASDTYQRGVHGEGLPHDLGRIGTRNLRSVWTVATQPYPGAHFATFPRKLVEPCIKAGTSERGVCPECGAPWVRVVTKGEPQPEPLHRDPAKRLEPGQAGNVGAGNMGFRASRLSGQEMAEWRAEHPDVTTGWRPACAHTAEPVPATVLDPFAGSGTTGLVAQSLSRRAILIDLNADYLIQAMGRNRDIPLGLVS